mmetsp:Transcript_22943/g.50421  ORF Transcript_22943/g.50421 Transcript_22943/m.50421 type:complete len:455 (-) Transcript_22943:172-1536(-)
MLSIALILSLVHHPNQVGLPLLDGFDVVLLLLLLVRQLIECRVQTVDLSTDISLLAIILGLGLVAALLGGDVLLLLCSHQVHHAIDLEDNLVEVTGHLHVGGQQQQGQVVGASSGGVHQSRGPLHGRGQRLVPPLHRLGLHESGRGAFEDTRSLRRGQHLHRLLDTGKLLGAQASSLRPLTRLVSASLLRLFEELLISLKLLRGVLTILLRVSLNLCGFRILRLFLLQGGLHLCQLLFLSRHQVLVSLPLLSFLVVCALQVGNESGVHILQNALDLVGGWCVAVDTLDRSPRLGKRRRIGQEIPDGGHVPIRDTVLRSQLQSPAQIGGHGNKSGASTRAGQRPDSLVQRSNCLLQLILGLQVLLVLLLSESLGLAGRLLVVTDVLGKLRQLSSQGPQLALSLLNLRAQLFDVLLAVCNVLGLGGGGLLAPARILVVDLLLGLAISLNLSLQFRE